MDVNELVKYGSVVARAELYPDDCYSTTVTVIGCGGTGSRLIPLLAQAIKNHNIDVSNNPRHTNYLKHQIQLVLCDSDEGVETKNLLRQNFIRSDVGRRKEIVLAERMSACYGLDCGSISDKFSLKSYKQFESSNHIFLDCTDNVEARRSIEEVARKYANSVIISGGNEDTFGQAFIGFNTQYEKRESYMNNIAYLSKMIKEERPAAKIRLPSIPYLLELYPEFKDTATLSCADVRLQNEQSMPINNLVATLMFNMFYNIMCGLPFNYNMVKCNLKNTFDTKKIQHPKAMLELYMKASCGYNNAPIEMFNEFLDRRFKSSEGYDWIMRFLNKHGKFSIIPISEIILPRCHYLDGTQLQEITSLMDKLRGE